MKKTMFFNNIIVLLEYGKLFVKTKMPVIPATLPA